MATTDDGSVALDVAQAEGQVWLLKVPAIVASSWKDSSAKGGAGNGASAAAGADQTLARVTCAFDPLNPDPEAAFEFTMELSGAESADIKAYSLNLQKDVVPTHIFSETQGKLAVEGKVERKFDIKPNSKAREEYRQLCRERERMFNMKTRTIQVLKDDRGNLMRPALPPMSSLVSKDFKRKVPVNVKNNDGKRTRRERGELEDHVFKLFEQQSNWALKQLVQKTDQPVAFLKEILNDLCTYNKRGTNQGTYELKPEYRKNSVEEKPAEAAT